jgi:5-formyltetrahydrofolate cyclo-ligase
MNTSKPEYSSPACYLHELDSEGASPMPPQDPAEAKEDLRLWRKAKREVLIAKRLALTAEERSAATGRITARLEQLLASEPQCLGFYWPFRGEYDPRPLVRALHQKGIQLALPVVVAKAQPLIFRPWRPGIKMAHGVWQIPIPAEGEPVQPDALLVPLVGFDDQRYRLGYGGGFYDRTIAAMTSPPRKIGVGFRCGRLRTIHPQPYDIPMDEIVVE